MLVTAQDGSAYDGRMAALAASFGEMMNVFWVPLAILVVCELMIFYTYCDVVPTLAIVEDTQPTSRRSNDETLPPYSEDPDKKPLLVETVEEIEPVAPSKPITSSIFGTVRHLKQTGGYFAHLRGAGISLLWVLATHWAPHMVVKSVAGFRNPGAVLAVALFAQIGAARLNMLWTHMVISKPSTKPWYRRFAPRSSFRKIALPTLVWAVTQPFVGFVPLALAYVLFGGMHGGEIVSTAQHHGHNCRQAFAIVAKIMAVAVTFVGMYVFVWFPVQVMFVRCQASLLAEDETPIVPFDRTFSGLFVAESQGGSGRLSMKDAWRSFDWNSRVRLAKVYVKGMGMVVLPCIYGILFGALLGLYM